jgi:hypothetical protein
VLNLPKIKAKSIIGGNSGDPLSAFQRPIRDVSKGQFKDVLFYKEEVKNERTTIQENSGSDHFFTVFSNKDYDEVSFKK